MNFKYFYVLLYIFLLVSCGNTDKNSDLCSDTFCEKSYQCDESDGECKKIENYCSDDNECLENEACDKLHNKCKEIIIEKNCEADNECKGWEFCNDEFNCSLKIDKCNISSDCTGEINSICDINTHNCIAPKEDTCLDTPGLCKEWEVCNSNEVCVLAEERCNSITDCNTEPKTSCNLNTHKCFEPETVICEGSGICIESFPYHNTGDTALTNIDNFNTYNCNSEKGEYGPEEVYTFTLREPGTILTMIKESGHDIDIHLLTSLDNSNCLARNDKGVSWHLSPGTYYLIADTYGMTGGNPGVYDLFVHFIKDSSNCAMKYDSIKRIGSSERLNMPATGKVVAEDHLVTNEEFEGSWPGSLTDTIENHYVLSNQYYQMNRSKPWCPDGEPSNEFGQGSTSKPPVEAETFYINMRWASGEVRKGEKYIIFNAINGKAIVAAAGYENGPGDLSRIGGASEEIHHYLNTSHLSTFTFASAINQNLNYGPIECN